MDKNLICYKCRVSLEKGTGKFSYLGRDFTSEVWKCPRCGLIYIPEETIEERMKKAEEMLEGK